MSDNSDVEIVDSVARAVVGISSDDSDKGREDRKRKAEDVPDNVSKRVTYGRDGPKDDDYDLATTPVDHHKKFSSSALLSVLGKCAGLHKKGKSLFEEAKGGRSGAFEEALKPFEKEIETLENIPVDNCGTTSQLKVYLTLGNAHNSYAKCLLESLPKKPKKGEKTKGTPQSRTVLIHFQKGVDACTKYNELAVESKMTDGSDMKENKELLWSQQNVIGMVLEEHYHEYTRAAKEYEKAYNFALSQFEDTKSTEWGGYVVVSAWNMGLALSGLSTSDAGRESWKRLSAALDFILNRLDVNEAEKKRRIKGFSEEYFNIGCSYAELELRNQGRYKEEFEVYKSIYDICNVVNNKEGMSVALTNMGNALDDMDGSNMRSILTMYWQSAEIAKEIGSKSLVETALGNLGSVFEGRMKELMEEFEKSSNISKVKIDFIRDLADCQHSSSLSDMQIDIQTTVQPTDASEIQIDTKSKVLYELVLYGTLADEEACKSMKKIVVREDEPSWWLRRRYFGEDLPNRSNISRQHFSISRDSTNPHKYYLKDSSCHGTVLNEIKIKPGQLIPLKNGDSISFLGNPRDPKLGFLFSIPT